MLAQLDLTIGKLEKMTQGNSELMKRENFVTE